MEIKCSSSKKLHPAQFSRHIHTRPCLSYWLQIDTIVWERHIRGKYSQFQNNEYVQLLADKMMTQGMLTQLRAKWDSWSAVRRKSSKKALVDTKLLGMLSTFMFREFNQWLHVFCTYLAESLLIFMKAFLRNHESKCLFSPFLSVFFLQFLWRGLLTKHIPKRRARSQE